jgi:hypothetical protein
MRVLYASRKGGKPLRFGMNQAKRIARSADEKARSWHCICTRWKSAYARTLGPMP